MIAVDTSALMAIVIREDSALRCLGALRDEPTALMSAVALAEALIVSARRGLGEEMRALLREVGPEVLPADDRAARHAAAAYDRWGKGVHPAALNIVDCFSYDAAVSRGLPLLYVGEDFARTDVRAAL